MQYPFFIKQQKRWLLPMVALILPAPMRVAAEPMDYSTGEMTTIVQEDFDAPQPSAHQLPQGWWAEGGKRVWVEDGRLHLDADPADDEITDDRHNIVATAWMPTLISGDVRIEFDAHVVSSVPDVCNINLFFFYSDPSGQPLYETRQSRADGAYAHYHELDGYICTFLRGYPGQREHHADGSPKARFRLRRCPGFNLVAESHDYHCKPGYTYRIAVTKQGSTIRCEVDGRVYVVAENVKPLAEGLIGFRTFRTHVWFDNLRVVQLPAASAHSD